MLEASGYTVLAASQADEALRLSEAHTGPIHLLLTDVVMPGMSGFELAERIGDRVPVLFMSGFAGDTVAQLPDGAPPMLEKPFGADDLLAAVRAAL